MPAIAPRDRRLLAALALAATAHAPVAGAALPILAQARPAGAALPGGSLVSRGRALFDDQRYEESVQTLSAALVRPSTSPADKVETYRLLAYDFIVLGRTEEAEAAVRGLFALEPDFSLPRAESPRFREFFAEVRARWEAEGRPGVVGEAHAAEPPPVRMQHASPAEGKRGEEIVLRGRIEDPGKRVDSVRLLFRTGTQGKFIEQPATLEDGELRVSLPPSAVQPPLVEYYLEALDKGRLPVAGRGDATAPLRVVVAAPAEASIFASPWLWGGAGAVVVGGIAAAVLLSRKSSSGGAEAAPGPGPGGSGGATSRVTVTVGE